ncbi:rho GTPase-activating protein 6 isoform X2 [Protopterus annectens]|uniref:rho GTPase-activating protein 6 isoform X2 n=1 Tax=Protopterus annectens TaxID=7888 RepID=UPI001CF9891A|nr:rho GTPase-activating protein 6 isoform X2 [Protopterus annectens]
MGDCAFFEKCISTAGDFKWNSMSGRSVQLKSVPIQSLSELERVRLQEVAFNRLQHDFDLGCQITIPRDGQKRKKSLRRKLDSLGKEKNKDKEFQPQAFGMPLSQVIANDRAHKQKQDSQREEEKDGADFVASLLQFSNKRQNKELSSSNSSLSSTPETPNECTSPNTPEPAPRARRRGGMSVDSITDLDDNQSRLLEALQLSLPAEAQSKKEKERDKKLSLNPIYRQVPRLVDSCCHHLEKYGLQTVGIFRVGSSKKRVRQLREEFDRGVDVVLDEEHSVHDVAALLKEFLRDMPDPLLTRELYTAFINTMLLEPEEQLIVLQLLVYLLPPCNCDTLNRLLQFLSTVAKHADDTMDKDGQEITGNKMTSLNLATIFGPNLLHKQKSTDKEFMVQSSARAEESTSIIAVVKMMIEQCEATFMVPPDLQNEVLMSLLETDPDVVDYLLRRKASQSSPEMDRTEDSYSFGCRHSSIDSNKASSGEVSPYDNNSPVLSERLQRSEDSCASSEKLFRVPEQYALVGHLKAKSRDALPAHLCRKDSSEEQLNIWGTWHSTLKTGARDEGTAGSCGNLYENSSLRQAQCYLSQGNLNSDWSGSTHPSRLSPDNGKLPVRRAFTTAGIQEIKCHAPVTRISSSPHIEASKRSSHLGIESAYSRPELHFTSSTEHIPQKNSEVPCFQNRSTIKYSLQGETNRNESRLPPPYPGPPDKTLVQHQKTPSSATQQTVNRFQRFEKNTGTSEVVGHKPTSQNQSRLIPENLPDSSQKEETVLGSLQNDSQTAKNLPVEEWQEWQRERWQIWELLSADNNDSLPETLV